MVNGNIIIPIKKAHMELSNNFLNISKKANNLRILTINKKYGSNYLFIFRPNFNGTSKNYQ
jgi:hypothetical protein